MSSCVPVSGFSAVMLGLCVVRPSGRIIPWFGQHLCWIAQGLGARLCLARNVLPLIRLGALSPSENTELKCSKILWIVKQCRHLVASKITGLQSKRLLRRLLMVHLVQGAVFSQTAWFIDSQSDLEPVIRAKDICHHRLVSEDTTGNRRAFRKAQRVVAKAVKQAKDKWAVSVANEAEDAKKEGRVRWKYICKLQSAHVGRKPVATSAILDEHGNLIESSDGLCAHWGRHFESILNVLSQFNADVIRDTPNHEVWGILDLEPAFEELTYAIRHMKRGTAGGQSGILRELISSGGEPLHRRIHALLLKIWLASDVPSDWHDAQIVPIHKKGDLRSCDNRRGIRLLDVVGKIFARIIQDRLEPLAAEVLPESQCGFRRGRGCVDMVFSARQLIEKAIEHESELFVLFVDLRKAYDSVPRSAL